MYVHLLKIVRTQGQELVTVAITSALDTFQLESKTKNNSSGKIWISFLDEYDVLEQLV